MTRWTPLAGLAVLNLVPLWLVLTGRIETADLLMAYVVDMWVAVALSCAQGRRLAGGALVRLRKVKERAGLVVLLLLLLVAIVVMTRSVLSEVTWDRGSVVAIVSVCLSQALGLFWNRQMTWPGISWRFLLLGIGAGLGLSTAHGYARLQDVGWHPAPLGDAWLNPVGEALVGGMLELNVSAVTIPALMLVTYRTLNELLLETWRLLGAGRSRPTAEGGL